MGVRTIDLDRHTTVVSVLREAAQINAEVEAVVEPAHEGRQRNSMTFAQWDRAADGVAGFLSARGVAKGDVVCLILPSSIDYAVLYAAAQRLGAITSGINPRMGNKELESVLLRAAPVLVVHDPLASSALPVEGLAVVSRSEAMAASAGDPPKHWPELRGDDPVAVVWTSGTTGMPKGALFDHHNLAAVARGTDVLSQPGDRRLSPLPFAHVAYMTRAWDEIAHGVTTVITPTPWRAEDAVRILEEEAITVAQGVPTQWALMLACPELDAIDRRALRLASTGAARMAPAHVAALRTRLGVPVVVRYTSTESSLGTGTDLGSSDEEVATTVGRPVPGVELRIVNDVGAPVVDGEVGSVLLRSDATMRGYWGTGPGRGKSVGELVDAETTAAVRSSDGWIITGDFGRLTDTGCLQLVGRAHERYIRGGYNVYPAEVEEVLATHPGVAKVAVIGMPDEVLGEIGIAVIVAASDELPTLVELRTHCAEQLADYKSPDGVVYVEELPLTPMMKVDPVQLAVVAQVGVEERMASRERNR
jgi:acyl-CoA synthetase (AMP-forming)/AMP-acid ligase II